MSSIIATYTMVAGGMSTRLPGNRVAMVTGTRAECEARLPDVRASMTVLPVKIAIED